MLARTQLVDFEKDAAGNPLRSGDILSDQYAEFGIHVTSNDPLSHPVMIFDTAAPTGGDLDLGTPHRDFGGPGVGSGGETGGPGENQAPLGNVLILSEDGDAADPDDSATGGTLIFTFDEPADVQAVRLLDIDVSGATIALFDADGSRFDVIAVPNLGDNSVQVVPVDATGVSRLEITLPQSGAVAGIEFEGESSDESANDLAGEYWINQQSARIEQDGTALTFINEHGGIAAGRRVDRTRVIADDWGGLVGNIDGGTIYWENGSQWSILDIRGDYTIGGKTASVEQVAFGLTFTNEHGDSTTGRLLGKTQVIADDWGGLLGNIDGPAIEWVNGSTWNAPCFEGEYNINGQPVRIDQWAGALELTNESGDIAHGRVLSSSRITAIDWGGLIGSVNGAAIEWGNATAWLAPEVGGDYVISGQPVQVEQAARMLVFTNENGDSSRGKLLTDSQLIATDWAGGLPAQYDDETINWANGTVWSRGAAGIRMVEESSFRVIEEQTITIPETPSHLTFDLLDLTFDETDETLNDAFEAALLDENGVPLVHTIGPGRDAFFNATEGESEQFSAAADRDGNTIRVDLTHIPAGTNATLVLRLLNNDSDTTTTATIGNVRVVDGSLGTPAGVPAALQAIADRSPVDFDQLNDLTASFVAEYRRTAFDTDTNLFHTDVALRNVAGFPVDAPLILGITNLSEPAVRIRDFDGITPDGIRYFHYADRVDDGTLSPGETTGARTLSFINPNGTQFTFDLVVLGTLNASPRITSTPDTEALIGNAYSYAVKATDPDEDRLTYTLMSAPEGMQIDAETGEITWSRPESQRGTHAVTVQVKDGRGGTDEQAFTVSLIDAPPNRPPVITTVPMVDAFAGSDYVYDADAVDPDGDLLTYSIESLQTRSVPIENAGFEDVGLADGDRGSISPAWVGGFNHGYNPRFHETYLGLVPEGQNVARIYRPIGGFYTVSQTLDETLTAGTTYRLQFNVSGNSPGTVELHAGGSVLVSDTFQTGFRFTTRTIEYTVASDDPSVGQPLTIRLVPSFSGGGVYYDDFTLTADGFADGAPEGAMFDADTGRTDWSPDGGDVGEKLIRLTAADGRGGIAEQTFDLVVHPEPRNHAPQIVSQPITDAIANSTSVYFFSQGAADNAASLSAYYQQQGNTRTAFPSLLTTGYAELADLAVYHLTSDWTQPEGMQALLERGGNIFFIGENTSFFGGQNASINNALEVLGSSMRLTHPSFDAGAHLSTRAAGRIIDHPLTAGVDVIEYSAPSTISGALRENELIFGDDGEGPLFAYEDVGNGTIFLLSDSNVIESFGVGGYLTPDIDNDQLLLNILEASRNVVPPYEYQVTAIDADGDTLSYELVDAPAGLTIDPQAGLIQWTATHDALIYGNTADVSVRVSDGLSSTTQEFTIALSLPGRSEIRGTKFEDANEDGQRNADEPGLEGWTIYIDQNNNSERDPGERFTTTDADGNYALTGLDPGTFIVREELEPRWTQTAPNDGHYSLDLTVGEVFTRADFANTRVDSDLPNRRPEFTSHPTDDFVPPAIESPVLYLDFEGSFTDKSGFANHASIDPRSTGGSTVTTVDGGIAGEALFIEGLGWLAVPNSDSLSPSEALTTSAWIKPSGQIGNNSAIYFKGELISQQPDWQLHIGDVGTGGLPGASGAITSINGTGNRSSEAQVVDFTFLNPVPLGEWTHLASTYDGETLKLYVNGVLVGSVDHVDVLDTSGSELYIGNRYRPFGDVGAFQGLMDELRVYDTALTADEIALLATPQLLEPTEPEPLQVHVGESFRYDAMANDPDYDPLTYNLAVAPDGMAIDPQRGILFWQPRPEDIGTHEITIRVRDGRGGFDLQTFELPVVENRVPLITTEPREQAEAGRPYHYPVRTQNTEGDAIEYRLPTAPAEMTIDPETGLVAWDAPVLGTHDVVIEADDGHGGIAQQSFTLNVVPETANERPRIDSPPVTGAGIGRSYWYRVLASDPNNDPLSFQLLTAPDGMTIGSNGLINWLPTFEQLGPHDVSIQVDDGRGGEDVQDFTVTVVTTFRNDPPRIVSNPANNIVANTLYSYDVVVNDPDGDPPMYSLTAAPRGMSIDADRGTIRWTPGLEQIGSHDVEINVFDGRGGTATQTFVLNVHGVNAPPLITSTPPTQAYVDHGFTYQIDAVDRDGDDLQYLLGGPAAMTIDAETGLIEWTPTAGDVGTHTIIVAVSDGQTQTRQTFDVEVTTDIPNAWPVVTSSPPFLATIDQPYRYTVEAFDPDGDAFEIQLIEAPDGMTLVNDNVLEWTPTGDQTGPHTVTIFATDVHGGVGGQRFTLTAAFNDPPMILTDAPVTVSAGASYRYDVRVHEPDGDDLFYALDAAPAGLTIDPLGRIQWSPTAAEIGTHPVEIVVTDGRGGEDRQTFDLDVTTDQTAPQVLVTVSENPVNFGGTVDIQVTAVDDVAVETIALTSNGIPVVLDANGRATLPLPTPGLLTLRGTATDPSGNLGEQIVDLNVIDPSDVDAPIVTITSPEFGDAVEGPIDVIGTVNDDSLAFYTLSFAPFEGGEFVEFARRTDSVTDGVLGRFDPSTLSNDSYFLQVYAVDANGKETVEQVLISVAGALKVGNFTLSFTDLSIPVAGIPITVARTYDSLNASFESDFGYGWRLEFADVDLRSSVAGTGDEEDLIYNPYYDGARVFVTLPGGERQGFTFRLTPARGLAGALFGIFDGAFVPDDDVTSTLTFGDATLRVTEFGEALDYGTGLPWNPASPLFGGTFTLTTLDGTRYTIDGNTGDLEQLTDRNGNSLSFSDAGIESSIGQSVTFERDARGRITAVIDPAGNRVTYRYDGNGDLVAVSDRAENETTYLYDQPGRPHYLTDIRDPLGRSGIRSDYDDRGRLIGMVDADGETIELAHDPDNFVETVRNQLGLPTVFEYDQRGNVVTETDAEGNITKRSYDARNNMLSEIVIIGEEDATTTNADDPADLATFFTYDAAGNVLTEADALGHVTRSTYDRFGNVLTTTDPLGNTTTNAYDARGNLLSITDPAGQVTRFTYDAAGNPLTLELPGGNTQSFVYDPLGNVMQQTDALGNVTAFTYDANGNQLTETRTQTTPTGLRTIRTETDYDAEGRARFVRVFEDDVLQSQTETRYDALGNRVEEIDPLGRSTKFVYDDRGLLIATIYPDDTPGDDGDNPRTRTEYDAAGQTVAEIDEAGRRTEYVYDRAGRRIATIFPDATPGDDADNPRTMTEYDEAGRVTAEINERGHRTEFEYDAAGRQTIVRDALGQASTTAYDESGRQIAVTDPRGFTTQFLYDDAGRPLETRLPDGETLRSEFDDAGRLARRIDQNGLATDYEYDALGRLAAVILPETDDPLTATRVRPRTEYEYDELGNLIVQRDALGRETRFEYNGQGRRTATLLPLGQRSTSQYDAAGRLTSATDFNGDTISYDYDARDRLTARRFPDLSQVSFTWTATGQRESVTDARGTTTYDYDERNRLLARTDPDGVQISYTYDAAGNRTSLTVPSGTTQFTFDPLNRMETVTDPDADVTRYHYDAASNLVRTAFPNGTEEHRAYDEVNRLLSLEHRDPLDAVFSSFDYELDAVGNRTAVTEQDGRRVEYDYDELYRLIAEDIFDPGETTPTRAFDYEYDLVGNRLRRSDTEDGETTYSYDDNDRLLDETTGGVTTEYTYDDNGNTLSKTSPSENVTYEWDFENRLVAADTDGDGTNDVAYEYDADGIRVTKTLDPAGTPEITRFLVDKNRPYAQVLEEYTPGGIIQVSYVHGRDLISQNRPATTGKSFYHVDGLGSTRSLTDAAGVVTDRYVYDAYGRTIGQVGGTENEYMFTGEQRDGTIGWDYLRARYLDAMTARFSGSDPFEGFQDNPLSLNKFLYANSNPVSYIDPSGQFSILRVSLTTATYAAAIEFTVVLVATEGNFAQASAAALISFIITFSTTAIGGPQLAAASIALKSRRIGIVVTNLVKKNQFGQAQQLIRLVRKQKEGQKVVDKLATSVDAFVESTKNRRLHELAREVRKAINLGNFGG